MVRRLAFVTAFLVLLPLRVAAQENAALVEARQAYEALDYRSAIVSVRRALGQQLVRGELIEAYEMLGFMYGALDSTSQAVEAFRNLIILDPDREPDALRVSPQITSLYASALGQVLVVRRVGIDSASFVAGSGRVPLRFDVSRPAAVRVRAVGDGSRRRSGCGPWATALTSRLIRSSYRRWVACFGRPCWMTVHRFRRVGIG